MGPLAGLFVQHIPISTFHPFTRFNHPAIPAMITLPLHAELVPSPPEAWLEVTSNLCDALWKCVAHPVPGCLPPLDFLAHLF